MPQRPTPAQRRHARLEASQRPKPARPDAWTDRVPVLGIDIGGVLVDRVAEGEDTSFFGSRPLDTPAVQGCHEAITQLLEAFQYRVHIVSKAGPSVSALSRKWLALQGLAGRDGIDPANLHFVRKRPDKHLICDRLGVTHFIDDRLDVLEHLASVEHKILFVGGLGIHEPPRAVPRDVLVVDSWPAVLARIAATLPARS